MTDEPTHDQKSSEANEPELNQPLEAEIEDPIGDETDGEAEEHIETEADIEAAEDDAESEAEAEPEIETEESLDLEEDPEGDDETASEDEDVPEFKPKQRPPVKLERLQKILAQSGVASRRKAEEMIEQGRVQVNGTTVTELGTKADAGRDHIRVDGKLLQGAERLRYFVLNKPRGFVTTVKDPEGRPTVMQFFDKMRERLYPVGRLDYMSEGLLLVTNDGELANRLTKASSGVEKTYLVKVAGIPTEGELDVLRAGVAIDKGKPGTGRVRTSPARIRQVRQGDNPWYEVVLIEGRNRELRKMFEEVGHFVEKIRRVGYGPLILDQEPGNLRELDAQELELLRKAADGKLKTPKAKEIRRRNMIDSLPPQKPAFKARSERPAAGPRDYQPKKSFGADKPARSGSGPAKFSGPSKFAAGRPTDGAAPRPAWKKDAPPSRSTGLPPARFAEGSTPEERPAANKPYSDRPAPRSYGSKPDAGKTFGARPAGRTFGAKPGAGKPLGAKPAPGRSFPAQPAWKKPETGDRTAFKKPTGPRPEAKHRPAPEHDEDLAPRKPVQIHIEPVQDFGRSERPARPAFNRPPYAGSGRTGADRAVTGRASSGRSSSGRSSSARPFGSEGGLARPFTTSSGKPRAGGPRPSSKPGREGGRPFGPPAGRSGPRSGPGSDAPRSSSDARSSFTPRRPSENKAFGRSVGTTTGAPKRPFRPREDGDSSGSRPPRPFTPRAEGAEGFRPRADSPRPERRTGTGWKPKPGFAAKPASADRSRPKSGGYSKPGFKSAGSKSSGYKGKTGGSGAKSSGSRPGGKRPGGKRP
jgi:23S rRNA pseudouridine2605 synthase